MKKGLSKSSFSQRREALFGITTPALGCSHRCVLEFGVSRGTHIVRPVVTMSEGTHGVRRVIVDLIRGLGCAARDKSLGAFLGDVLGVKSPVDVVAYVLFL